MSEIENTPANQTKIDEVAEYLQGTCKSLEEGLEHVFGEGADVGNIDIQLLHRLDDQTMCCEGCNWWCETSELDEDQLCGDCRDDEG